MSFDEIPAAHEAMATAVDVFRQRRGSDRAPPRPRRTDRVMDVVEPDGAAGCRKSATDESGGVLGAAGGGPAWFDGGIGCVGLDPPTFRWFVGAETNLAWNCVVAAT